MKKLILLLLIISGFLYSQTGYVQYDDKVYDFLERLSTINVISGYNQFELPMTAKKVGDFLVEANNNRSMMNLTDLKSLDYYLKVFDFDITGEDRNFERFFPEWNFRNHFTTDKNKSAIRFVDDKFSMFINFEGASKNLSEQSNLYDDLKHITIFRYGGSFRGSFLKNFHYYLKSWNGTFLGNRSLAEKENFLKYNYKFNENPSESVNANYFDETEGYFLADFDLVRFKVGNDRLIFGYPGSESVLGSASPPVDHILMNINYKFFKFTWLHGKLLGDSYSYMDWQIGSRRDLEEKYLVYHRFEFNFSKHFTLGLGESIIYSRRGIDLSYLNPFAYYKSVEHLNQDRDNSKIFMDFVNNSITGLKFFGMIYIDDLDFSKFGTKWVGNTLLYNLGISAYPFYNSFPLTFNFNYLRIDPYFYTHRILENTYSSFGLPLGSEYLPNSETFKFSSKYQIAFNLSANFQFTYSVHGANEYSQTGELIKNYGGDLNYGYFASRDESEISLLDGLKEYSRKYFFALEYQPLPGYFVDWYVHYYNLKYSTGISEKTAGSTLAFRVKI
ncbi:MAG: hypothetical protein SCALA702_31830 [Melioribacteraceae bacterium]|nr:MAG: hypothetical protein SCALA702_31830 [Melioribacteraceae bacterium]